MLQHVRDGMMGKIFPQLSPQQPDRNQPPLSHRNSSQRSLSARTLTSAGWVIAWRIIVRVIGFFSTLILARLLTPEDFGLVALGLSFSTGLDAFSYFGIQDALIREKTLDKKMYDTAATLNVVRGIVTAGLIAGIAYPAAAYLDEPRLVEVIGALGLGVLVSTFESMGLLDFRRNLDFRTEFVLTVVPRLTGNICVIAIAAIWHSYWALIIGTLVMRSARTVLSYFMHPYRPAFSLDAWRRIAGFSFWTWAMGVAVLVRDRSDSIIVGRLLGTADVGIFSLASEVATLPTSELVEPLTHVLFPGFSAVRNTGGDVGDPYMRAIALAFMVTVPAGLGVSLIAKPLVLLLLGPTWIQAIPLVQIIAFAGILKVITAISTTAFRADGIPKITFFVTCIAALLRIALVVALTARFGLVGGAIGTVMAVTLEEIAFLIVGFRRYCIAPAQLLRDTWRILLASAAMAIVLYATGLGWTQVDPDLWVLIPHLLAACLLGAVIYSTVLYVTWKLSGRPDGAESYVLRLITALLQRTITKLGLPGFARRRG